MILTFADISWVGEEFTFQLLVGELQDFHALYLRMFCTYFQNNNKIMKKITDYSKSRLKIIRQT